jgi:hypothetical protein
MRLRNYAETLIVLLLAPLGLSAADSTALPKAMLGGPKPKPVAAPSAGELDAAIDRGIALLVKRQNTNGSWGSAHNTTGLDIYAPVPGAFDAFRAGTTALCLSALIETGGRRPGVAAAIDRGEAWMLDNIGRLRRATPNAIYNNWGHAYAIEALVRMLHRRPDDAPRAARIRQAIDQQIAMLGRYECVDGGWSYYDLDAATQRPSGSPLSFLTATCLVALDAARATGAAVPERLVRRAMASIRRQRKPDFTYCYGEYVKYAPMEPVNLPAGSLGRSQACNLAMRLWGDKSVNDAVLLVWLDRLFARNGWLSDGRKRPIPHESWFSVAGYFFYYGHYYASLCIEQIPSGRRPEYQDQLARVLLPLQEKDGSWWDFPLYDYHQQYGTAFALLSLSRCRHR